MRRLMLMVAGALAAWLSLAESAAVQPTRSRRIVWRGEEIYHEAYAYGGRIRPVVGIPAEYVSLIRVSFKYVEEFDENGAGRWMEQQIAWSAYGSSVAPGYTAVTCEGSDSLDLTQLSPDEADKRLMIPCTKKDFATYAGFFYRPPNRVKVPKTVDWSQLRSDCSYSEERPGYRYTVSVVPDVEAIVELDPDPDGEYGRFVPEPGRKMRVSARTVPAVPAQFRFVLEDVSRFPGYAMNANVDPAYFQRAALTHLEQSYKNDGVDLIFDPADYEDHDRWTAPAGPDFGFVETVGADTSATAAITAMDYGAVGRLRVYAKVGDCGGWFPASVQLDGQSRSFASLPMDEDSNLIADALTDYRGEPGRDDEDTPAGDGTPGDGLTAFEEYRGFLIMGDDCRNPATDVHVRTAPHHKHVFVAGHVSLTDMAEEYFGWGSDLSVMQLCRRHLSDLTRVDEAFVEFTPAMGFLDVPAETRVVNFTLAQANQQRFRNHIIHAGPQHGLYIRWDHALGGIGGMLGFAIPTQKGGVLGSPGTTALIVINLGFLRGSLALEDQPGLSEELMGVAITTITHELGHGVGIPHHSDSRAGTQVVIGKLNVTPDWSALQALDIPLDAPDAGALRQAAGVEGLLVAPGAGCKEGDPLSAYRNGEFAGCLASVIIRRGQQHSGDTSCPMRLWRTEYYEPPGVTATYRWSDEVTLGRGDDAPRWFVDAWGGSGGDLLPFTLTVPRPHERLGTFCWSGAGTDENARRDYHNLAGDAGRPKGCQEFVRVNDNAGS